MRKHSKDPSLPDRDAYEILRDETVVVATWTPEEHQTFLRAIRKHGRNWEAVNEYLPQMKKATLKAHAFTFKKKIERSVKANDSYAMHDMDVYNILMDKALPEIDDPDRIAWREDDK